MQGTVRTMAQIGTVNSFLVMLHTINVARLTRSLLLTLAEAFIMLRMCLVIALRAGYRFAGLR